MFVRVPLFVLCTYTHTHYTRTHTHTHTHTLICRATSQLTPAEYNTNPLRLSRTRLLFLFLLSRSFSFSPGFPTCTCLHVSVRNMRLCAFFARLWKDRAGGASDQQYVEQIREETVSNEQRQRRQRAAGVWKQRSAVNNTACI